MVLKYFVALAIVLLIRNDRFVEGNLICYQCKDCSEISDDQAKECPPRTTTTTEVTSTTTGVTTTEATTTEATTTEGATPPEPEEEKTINLSLRAASDLEPYCYEEHVKDATDKIVVNRGCAYEEGYCDDPKYKYCEPCKEDRCNSGKAHRYGYIEISALVATNLLFSTVLSVFNWK